MRRAGGRGRGQERREGEGGRRWQGRRGAVRRRGAAREVAGGKGGRRWQGRVRREADGEEGGRGGRARENGGSCNATTRHSL